MSDNIRSVTGESDRQETASQAADQLSSLLSLTAYKDFDTASAAVLSFLQSRFNYKLWMTTRTNEPYWVVLNAADQYYGVEAGQVFLWEDSYCCHMARGTAPMLAPNAADVDLYVQAPINRQVKIGAYIGVPIYTGRGDLFGTLCAIDPEPQNDRIHKELDLLQMLANMLGLIAEKDLRLQEKDRALEKIRDESESDPLTGLVNRRGWEARLEDEESHCRVYGSPACVLILDLDGLKQVNDQQGHQAGDQLIRQAADCLRSAIRCDDIAARIGGDEFSVLATETGPEDGARLRDAIVTAFDEAGIALSAGFAAREPGQGMIETMVAADMAMYEMKVRHRQQVSSPGR